MKNPEGLLKLLDEYELDIFTWQSFEETTHEFFKNWYSQFRTLIKKGLITIIEKGKYCRHNFRNEYVIGNYLAGDGVIGYWSALSLHGLTEQISNTIFVQTQKLKRNVTVFDTRYQFIKIKPQKVAGIEVAGYGNHSYRITDREKTIMDCFDLPEYGGEFPGIIRAFVNKGWNEQKLVDYAIKIDNTAAIKRMGFCAELFGLPMNGFIDFAKRQVTRTVSLFDNTGKDSGTIITSWGLRLNVSREDILAMKHY
jgi:predicted transcriptional regulator of viral defense system